MKVRGQFQTQLKNLGQGHIHFMEDELQKRGVQILSSNVRHTLQFSGCWQVKFQGEAFAIKVSGTGTALTYTAHGLYTYGRKTHQDFDDLIKAMQAEVPKLIAARKGTSQQP